MDNAIAQEDEEKRTEEASEAAQRGAIDAEVSGEEHIDSSDRHIPEARV